MEKLGALRVLLASNNRIGAWAEVERLAALPGLEELLLAGNPLQCDFRDRSALPEYRLEARRGTGLQSKRRCTMACRTGAASRRCHPLWSVLGAWCAGAALMHFLSEAVF